MARFERRPTPGPSFNRGWRLGVAIGAALALLVYAWSILSLVIGVWDV